MDSIRNGEAAIAGDNAKHLTRVLRVEAGQRYEVSDNNAVWLAEVTEARKDRVNFRMLEPVEERHAPVEVHLWAALIKFDRFERMIEAATELGVATITPFAARRSERGLDRAAAKRAERWRRIAVEASEQSRRDHLPEIAAVAPFDDVLAADASYRFVLDENAGAQPILGAAPARRAPGDRVALLVGPEGGWTAEERSSFIAAGWAAVSLGPQILRTETAAAAALAIISARWQSSERG